MDPPGTNRIGGDVQGVQEVPMVKEFSQGQGREDRGIEDEVW